MQSATEKRQPNELLFLKILFNIIFMGEVGLYHEKAFIHTAIRVAVEAQGHRLVRFKFTDLDGEKGGIEYAVAKGGDRRMVAECMIGWTTNEMKYKWLATGLRHIYTDFKSIASEDDQSPS